jgi:hypothetical protein
MKTPQSCDITVPKGNEAWNIIAVDAMRWIIPLNPTEMTTLCQSDCSRHEKKLCHVTKLPALSETG